MILFIGKKKFLKYLEQYSIQIDKEYSRKLAEIDEMGFDYDSTFKLRQELFWETNGKISILKELIRKLD